MAVQRVEIDFFLQLAQNHPVVDVRSPGEFIHAHIPGAYSLPLFTDEERRVVGTAYKQQSREKAIKIGLEFFGKKMVDLVEQAEKIISEKNGTEGGNGAKTVLVHCWRGGMRSAAVAWLLDLYGFKVFSLIGGYKVFRSWVLSQFERDYPFKLLGGYTGSGKTEVLRQIEKHGQPVVDLELLAQHKGSAFGNIGMPEQPSQEMFENKLAVSLKNCVENNTSYIWIEDESQRIGTVNVPITLWKLMRTKPVLFLNIPFENRLQYIVECYGNAEKEKLINAIVRIQKRLGGLETKTAINHLLEGNLTESFRILLKYYDKCYTKGLHERDQWEGSVKTIDFETVNANEIAKKLLESKLEKKNA